MKMNTSVTPSLPMAVRRWRHSAAEMKPWPSRSKDLKASSKSRKVPHSLTLSVCLKMARNSSNEYCFSPATNRQAQRQSASPVQWSQSSQFSSVRFSSVRFSLVRFSSVRFSSVQFSSVQFSLVRFGSVWFSSVQFRSVRFSSVQFSSVRFSSVRFGSVQFGSVQFGLVQFSSVQSKTG